MPIVLGIIVAVIVIFAAVIGTRWRRRRMQREHDRWLRAIDLAVGAAFHKAGLLVGTDLRGHLVDQVWHRPVMLAHYELGSGSGLAPDQVRAALSHTTLSQLVLTDAWIQPEDNGLNFDVAYLVNDATKAYVADLHRVE